MPALQMWNELTDAPPFSLDGLYTKGKVVKVWNGNTATIILPFKGELMKFSCRNIHACSKFCIKLLQHFGGSCLPTCWMALVVMYDLDAQACAASGMLQLFPGSAVFAC
eukprot:72832-Chlamydomonas_euryale.AAC.7